MSPKKQKFRLLSVKPNLFHQLFVSLSSFLPVLQNPFVEINSRERNLFASRGNFIDTYDVAKFRNKIAYLHALLELWLSWCGAESQANHAFQGDSVSCFPRLEPGGNIITGPVTSNQVLAFLPSPGAWSLLLRLLLPKTFPTLNSPRFSDHHNDVILGYKFFNHHLPLLACPWMG